MPQTLLPTWSRGGVGIIEGTGLDELHADSMWATWTCWLMPLMSITSPQKHLDRRSLVAWVACIPNPTSRISTLSRRGASGIRRSRPPCDWRERPARLPRNRPAPGRSWPRCRTCSRRARARIEAAAPLPLISAERIARSNRDRADVDVAIIDKPVFLAGFDIAAAGEGGHSP
jgi:hypothetical protein